MKFNFILTAAAIVVLIGGLIAFGVRRKDAAAQENVAIEIQKVKIEETKPPAKEMTAASNSTKEAVAPDAKRTANLAETMARKVEPSAAPNVAPPSAEPEMKNQMKPSALRDDRFDGRKIVRTEAEWRQRLTPEQFYVLREKGTEKPYTGKYTDYKKDGDFHCAACGLALFSSRGKFDSGTGWASFFEPIAKVNIAEEEDTSLEETRTEVLCARCNSHLGHVFDDGPEPTGLRYCINSIALEFRKRK